MKNQLIRALIFIILVCLIAAQVLISARILTTGTLFQKDVRVNSDNGIITINYLYSPEPIIRIAPYQDFAVIGTKKISLKSAFVEMSEEGFLLKNASFSNSWTWKLSDPDISYTYNLRYLSNSIILKRTVYSSSQNEVLLGQSIRYCQTCVVLGLNQKIITKLTILDQTSGHFVEVVVPASSKVFTFDEAHILEIESTSNIQQINF